MKYNEYNGTCLAYIGDAYYELEIRKYLLNKDIVNSKDLQKYGVMFVSATAHAYIYNILKDELNEEEHAVFLRGRNGAPRGHRKNLDRVAYQVSSGFEAILGYLYLKGDFERLDYLIKRAIEIVEQKQ